MIARSAWRRPSPQGVASPVRACASSRALLGPQTSVVLGLLARELALARDDRALHGIALPGRDHDQPAPVGRLDDQGARYATPPPGRVLGRFQQVRVVGLTGGVILDDHVLFFLLGLLYHGVCGGACIIRQRAIRRFRLGSPPLDTRGVLSRDTPVGRFNAAKAIVTTS